MSKLIATLVAGFFVASAPAAVAEAPKAEAPKKAKHHKKHKKAAVEEKAPEAAK